MIDVVAFFMIGEPYVIQLQKKALFVSKLSRAFLAFFRRDGNC
jgi:hypothetical protein